MTLPLHSFPLANSFFKPLLDLSVPRHMTRDCPALSDQDYVRPSLLRTPGAQTTGRAFLDTHQVTLSQTPARSSFFDASASPRRLQHLRATNEALVRTMTRTMDDPFAAFPEMAHYQLFAGDGHWHAAAAHDPRDHKGIKHATALLPGINYADRNGPQFDDCPIIVFPYIILLWHPGAHETGRPQFL